MVPFTKPADEVLAILGSSHRGLHSAEAIPASLRDEVLGATGVVGARGDRSVVLAEHATDRLDLETVLKAIDVGDDQRSRQPGRRAGGQEQNAQAGRDETPRGASISTASVVDLPWHAARWLQSLCTRVVGVIVPTFGPDREHRRDRDALVKSHLQASCFPAN